MGFYYSLYEWFNPLWLADRRLYVEKHMIPQFKDVVTRLQAVNHLQRRRVGHAIGRLEVAGAAGVAVQRVAGRETKSIVERSVGQGDAPQARRLLHDRVYGAGLPDASHPWEENRGMGFSYGYNRNEPLSNYRTGRS